MVWVAVAIMCAAIAFFAWVLCCAASTTSKIYGELMFDDLDGNDEDEE